MNAQSPIRRAAWQTPTLLNLDAELGSVKVNGGFALDATSFSSSTSGQIVG